MSLDDLEKKLYQKKNFKRFENKKSEKEQVLDGGEKPSPEPLIKKDWNNSEDQNLYHPTPLIVKTGRRLVWILGGMLLIVLAVAGYFSFQFLKIKEISFRIIGPGEVRMGVPFDINVSFRNDSTRVLKDAKLVVSLPEGAVFLGKPLGENLENRALNDIGPGSFIKEIFQVMFVDGISISKNFEAVISYNPDTLGSARFEKKSTSLIKVGESIINLSISLPERVLSGDQAEIKIKYQNIGDLELTNLGLETKYPKEFSFKSATPGANQLNNFWDIGNLMRGSEGEIVIKGVVSGNENANFPLEIKIETEALGKKYVISSQTVNLVVAASPLSLNISLNGSNNVSYVLPGDELNFRLNYKNMTDVSLQNVVIKTQFVSELFNLGTLKTNGFFSSLDNTITWNVANTSELRLLESNAEGSLDFSIGIRSDFIPKRLSDKNFSLKLKSEIESPTVPSYISAEKTTGFANFETKVGGIALVDSKAFFRDATSGILNNGSLPPKVNTPIEYTIHWVVSNYITDVTNVKLNAFLQAGVIWTGNVKSNVPSVPTFDSNTQEISWTIDRLAAARGFVNQPAEAIFQVRVTPSTLDEGKFKSILGATSLTAHDEFVNVDIVGGDGPLSTELVDDSTIRKEDGVVVK